MLLTFVSNRNKSSINQNVALLKHNIKQKRNTNSSRKPVFCISQLIFLVPQGRQARRSTRRVLAAGNIRCLFYAHGAQTAILILQFYTCQWRSGCDNSFIHPLTFFKVFSMVIVAKLVWYRLFLQIMSSFNFF